MKKSFRSYWSALPLAALLVVLESHAMYKVIGPDGKVTYTDRPPAAAEGNKVLPVGAGSAATADIALPLELRQATARYPVTLYTSDGCEPCEPARQLLRQRGIPYAERQLSTSGDGDALLRLSGGRDVPTLTIGAQALRGLSSDMWNSYLDSAGYPRESRLPSNYQYPAATPLTERRELNSPQTPRPQAPAAAPAPVPSTTAPDGIKF